MKNEFRLSEKNEMPTTMRELVFVEVQEVSGAGAVGFKSFTGFKCASGFQSFTGFKSPTGFQSFKGFKSFTGF